MTIAINIANKNFFIQINNSKEKGDYIFKKMEMLGDKKTLLSWEKEKDIIKLNIIENDETKRNQLLNLINEITHMV